MHSNQRKLPDHQTVHVQVPEASRRHTMPQQTSTSQDITPQDPLFDDLMDLLYGTSGPEDLHMGGSNDPCPHNSPSTDGGSCDLCDLLADFQSDASATQDLTALPCSTQPLQSTNVACSSPSSDCGFGLSAQEVAAMLLDSEPMPTRQQQQQAAASGPILSFCPPGQPGHPSCSPCVSLYSCSSRTVTTALLATPQEPPYPEGCFNAQPVYQPQQPEAAVLQAVPPAYQPCSEFGLPLSYSLQDPLELLPAHTLSVCSMQPQAPAAVQLQLLLQQATMQQQQQQQYAHAASSAQSLAGLYPLSNGPSSPSPSSPSPSSPSPSSISISSLPALLSPTGSGLSSHMCDMAQQPMDHIMPAPQQQQQQQHVVQAVGGRVQKKKKKQNKPRKVRVADLMREQLRDQQQQQLQTSQAALLHSIVAQVNGY